MTDYVLGAEGAIERVADGAIIPVDDGNGDYRSYVSWLAAGNLPLSRTPAAPTEADVMREYERRLFVCLGARDLAHAAFIRADNDVEMRALAAKPERSAEEAAWLADLHRMDAAVAILIERYNAMPSPPPLDFTADVYWGANA